MDDTSRRVSEYDTVAGAAAGRGALPDSGGVTVSATPADATTAGDDETDRRTGEIRAEIEQTREEMSETIDAIQDKLSPRKMVARATERVTNATTERVREMADSAGDTAQELMHQTRDTAGGFVQTIQQHPIPAVLIGLGAAWLLNRTRETGPQATAVRRAPVYRADGEYRRYDPEASGVVGVVQSNPVPAVLAGLGLGWLAYSSRTGASGSSSIGRSGTMQYRAGAQPWSGYAGQGSEFGGQHSGSGEGLGGKLSESAGRVSESATEMASRAREYVGDTGQALQSQGRRARGQMQRMLEDSPLLVGAGALLIGAAFGLALPETETENQLMGEARDTVIERTQEMARGAASHVQEAAGTLADNVMKQSQ